METFKLTCEQLYAMKDAQGELPPTIFVPGEGKRIVFHGLTPEGLEYSIEDIEKESLWKPSRKPSN